jgi:hypothetical protein
MKIRRLLTVLVIASLAIPFFAQDTIDLKMAEGFAGMALRCIQQEFPNKPSHVMNDEKEVLGPKEMHPAFYGCFDWHSSVHGHWMLIRLLKRFPNLPQAKTVRHALSRNLTADNLLQETVYFQQKGRKSFERTYGWAWLLKLVEELQGWDDPDGKTWRENIRPLEQEIVAKYLNFLPKQTYPIRTGVHPNTAFGIAFALDYARAVKNSQLETLLTSRAKDYYQADQNCPAAWEPSGEDFFSPCLMEADLMRRILPQNQFTDWFNKFLPQIAPNLLTPATVTDRTDGKLVHLDGLNLSRAWCMKHIAASLPPRHKAVRVLKEASTTHAADALSNIHSGDYSGEHWLASFATYLLSTN